MFRWIILMAMAFCLSGCRSHVLTDKTELSRDHTYISFQKLKKPYVRKGEVGGEQISFIKIIAFAGDRFDVAVTSTGGRLDLYVEGEGVRVEDSDEQDVKKRVTVAEDRLETFVEISLTAHPAANYTLTVTPL
ncbi:MAG: hypothetical protein QNK37_09330 [Acidobacteriota bacterium]|nr:hypothetical protein [Acidobacteriota bacterium]